MHPRVLEVVLLAGVGLVLVATFAPSDPLSLATDVGVRDEDACEAVRLAGPAAVERLESSGFPHATLDPVEVYRLVHAGRIEAAVRIDWTGRSAGCVASTHELSAAEIHLEDAAYRVLVGELQHVLETGAPSKHPGNAWTLFWGSDVRVPSNPSYSDRYELELARWSAGRLASEATS